MSGDRIYGVGYYSPHIWRILRAENHNGGGSIVSQKDFNDIILNQILTNTILEYSALLPSQKLSKAIKSVDKRLPDDLVDMGFKIDRFFKAHGPFSPLAIGMMNTIIWMERMGMTDYKAYFRLLDRLDTTPADSFSHYIEICKEFEKEMKV